MKLGNNFMHVLSLQFGQNARGVNFKFHNIPFDYLLIL